MMQDLDKVAGQALQKIVLQKTLCEKTMICQIKYIALASKHFTPVPKQRLKSSCSEAEVTKYFL